MSDTPRVDAAEIRHGKAGYSYLTVNVEFARQLERELRRLHAENERWRKALESIAANACCDKCQEAALVAKAALRREDV